jgi:hypothetical protein
MDGLSLFGGFGVPGGAKSAVMTSKARFNRSCRPFPGMEAARRYHRPEPGGWLQCLDQDGAPRQADDVQAPVDSVRPVHVGMPGRTEHGCIPCGWAAEAVRGRIVARVGLGFDDHAADSIDEQSGPGKILGDGDGIPGEERRRQGCGQGRALLVQRRDLCFPRRLRPARVLTGLPGPGSGHRPRGRFPCRRSAPADAR